MTDVSVLVQAGKDLGFAGEDLQKFVTEQQEIARDQRSLEREKIKATELEKETLELADRLEREKLAFEKEKERERLAFEKQKLDLEKAKLDWQKQKVADEHSISKTKSKLPPFNEDKDKFDSYITRFESVATLKKWKKDEWSIQLSLLLTGKALDVFYALSDEDQKDYDIVKEALMRKYLLTEDEFRKQFFTTKVETGETPTQFMTRIQRLFTKWLDASKVGKTYDGVSSLMIREQFLRRCHADLAAYLREKKLTDVSELAKSAQVYIDAHGGTIFDKTKDRRRDQNRESVSHKTGSVSVKVSTGVKSTCTICKKSGHAESDCWFKDKNGKSGENKSDSEKRCFKCNAVDHIATNCPNKKREVASAGIEECDSTHGVCNCVNEHVASACVSEVLREVKLGDVTSEVIEAKGKEYKVHSYQCQKPIKICACLNLPISEGSVNGEKVKVMRDTGCSSVVVKSELVKPEQFTGKYKDCMLIDGSVRRFPVAEIQIQSKYFEGTSEALVMKTPVFDLIIGNITGIKVSQSSEQCSHSEEKQNGETGEFTEMGSYDENMIDDKQQVSKSVSDHTCNEVTTGDVSSTQEMDKENESSSMGENEVSKDESMKRESECKSMSSENDTGKSGNETRSGQTEVKDTTEVNDSKSIAAVMTRAQKAASKKPISPLVVPPIETVSKEVLTQNQKDDPSLKKYWKLVGRDNAKEMKSGFVKFEVRKGVLYRIFTPRSGGKPVKQVIVPKDQREKVLCLAHDGLMSGHFGIKRTQERVMSNFYWPGVTEDVVRYCRSCDVCQKTVPKGKQGKAPLGTMPLIKEPFKRVAVDLIGPIVPCSERGHRYIITLVDYATRYPEALPLKNIDTITVAEALIEMFCRIGFPEELLDDRGTQFLSEIMQEVNRLLSIKQLRTSPYHPQCNGLCEKFNGTLKTIVKKMCSECPKQWDRYLPAVLFAYRTTVQESTGYSPFELVFGRKVRGPMDILRAYWTQEAENEEDTSKTVYQYVLDLKQRLEETCEIAQAELLKARERQKMYYDRKARPKSLKVGTRVLLLLPVKNNKLLLQWKGPYEVIEKMSPVNYRIQIGKKVKNFHVNMLKQYHERDSSQETRKRSHNDEVDTVDDEVEIEDDIDDESETDVLSSIVLKDGTDEDDTVELIEVCPLKATETLEDVKICDKLDDSQKQDVRNILVDFDKVLTNLPGNTNVETHTIRETTQDPVRVKSYPIPYSLRETIRTEVKEMSHMGITRPSKSPYAAMPVLVDKPDGSKRFCVSYKKLNAVTVFDGEPMPNPDDIYIKMRKKKFRSKIDLAKGYWQIRMDEESIEKTAFVTPDGLYEFVRMPFGLKNSAATFNRLMRKVLGDVENVGCFVDDVVIYTDTWDEHMKTLRIVLQKLKDAGLTVRPSKCLIGFTGIEFLGHEVDVDTLKPRSEKVDEIIEAERPRTKKQVQSFMALVGYYAKFIPSFADIGQPLTDLTRKGEPDIVKWGQSQQNAFDALKKCVSMKPVLKIIDFGKIIYVQTDASGVGLGGCLMQKHDAMMHPCRFLSRKLKRAERNYSVIERECLAIVWAIEKLQVFLYGREFVLLTDHEPLTFIQEAKVKNGRVMRWSMFLQDWSFRIESIKGVDNMVADYLSRA